LRLNSIELDLLVGTISVGYDGLDEVRLSGEIGLDWIWGRISMDV
jgi:hypothetical protein